MSFIPLVSLLLASPAAAPQPLTEAHLRDIGCIATLGLIAYDQGRKAPGADAFPDIRERGRRWAGIAGDRAAYESGQPREVIAYAITEAVKAEQQRAIEAPDPAAYAKARFALCQPRMDADLLAADPLPKPERPK